MTALSYLIRRNTKLFFKDKGMFFTSMITPLILIVLFVTFLGNVYRDAFTSSIPPGMIVPDSLTEGFVGGFLFSSLLAVCCVTVSFCANLLMVQDKVTGARKDLTIAPVKPWVLSLSYYLSTVIITAAICYIALGVCFAYLAIVGWYLSITDVLLTMLDVALLVLFGTALSSAICFFLSTQGQISAVSAIISATYGFLCGAYMPLSQFSEGLRNVLGFLPGTYGTALLHNHLMGGVMTTLEEDYFPKTVVEPLRDAFDINLYFFSNLVELPTMYLILGSAVMILVGIYALENFLAQRKSK
ncbi:MAG: ABC transporter permease [Lysinibacillus sp.]